ncbi:uncharacterized protein LOC125235178 [Leguminivora glycinivorella]|uniref:uncharacterized protein LOC125235178 n=1 Tax=Leguminivora glycinivorella TaxID=1035111 RepID=UPI00200E4BAE|nr:uncharacterized protein LOC125235178 [Leguminivora glycinivorella]
MDGNIKKSCPNCSQLYNVTCIGSHLKGNIPLFLTCGHTMCETCIQSIIKFNEPIECKVCKQSPEMTISDPAKLVKNKKEFYKMFPVNMSMLGEIAMELMLEGDSKNDHNENYFVDLKSIIQNTDYTTGQCIECHQFTTKMCQQCQTILCDNCFNKTHKNFVVFKTHVLQNIEPLIHANKCKIHSDKTLDYFCKDCQKSICMDCLMVGGEKSCKNHNVASMQEVNEGFLEDLNGLFPKVDETFRRLTKTAVDVGHLLYNIENQTGTTSELTKMIATVEQHFSKLNSIVQKHKTEVTEIITKLKCAEKESLYKVKEDITKTIKKAKEVINTMTLSLDKKKMKQLNLCVLLEDAKQIAEAPWYLNKSNIKNENLNVAVNDDVCNLISDYIHLEGNAKSGYSLILTAELEEGTEIPPAPIAPVYPPELPKDVRQKKAPKQKAEKAQQPPKSMPFYDSSSMFRSKGGSTSSINSVGTAGSDSSHVSGATRFSEAFSRPVVQPVSPFTESRVPRQLHEGSQEMIYITHIVDPHNFYVQRACHQTVVKEMLREFKNSVSSPKPSIAHITEGKLYLAFNKTDNMWQRCRIVSIDRKKPDKPICTVFCIDFGSTELVPADKLRLLQPGRVQSPPPLAINCCLANCEPKCGTWTCEDSYLIQNIINNKQAVIYIRNIQSTSNFGMRLVCDVTTFEDGVSLAHALLFHERAKLINPKLHYPRISGLREKPKLFMLNNNLKLKSKQEVNITHICSPDKFYVRECHLQNSFEKLTDDLEQEYSLALNTENVHLPEVGMVYVVNTEAERRAEESRARATAGWARALVLELPGRGRVRVLLVDSGAVLLVHWRALRPVRPHFTQLRALATECHLAGVTPLNKKWSAASVALLHRFEDRVLELHVEDNRNRGSLGVTLYDRGGDEPVCVNNEMIKYKFAITFGLFRFNLSDSESQGTIHKGPQDEKKKSDTKRNDKKIKILTHDDDIKVDDDAKADEENLEAKDKGPLRLEAKLLQYQSPSLLYVSLVHQQKTFSLLFEKLQTEYSKANSENEKKDWKEGDRCCAFCEESKTWRRAVIVELVDNKAKLFFSDFALVETVPLDNLRALTPDFESLGDAAIKCHLSGVMPAVGTEWPSLTKEYLKELLDVYARVFITKIGSFKDRSMPVELWVYHTTQGGALEPDTSEWRCLNLKIIEQGLAIPDKSETAIENSNATNDDDEMLSFGNLTGSVREWLQLEPLPTKPLLQADVTGASTPELEDVNAHIDQVQAGASNTVFISDWLPAEPLPTNEFTGVPTYIDNDGVVFLHQLSQEETLELIRKALEVRFKKPDPKAKYAKWTVGEPCVALYFLDNRFYRGRVLEVNKETSSCLVQYVDYGNEEVCSFVNMRKSIALHQIPIQAHKCILARIRPIGNQWDRTTLDYIHKSVVEKHCLVKISGERIGDLLPIELKYDKLWINDHLADFEMAEYTDGSKTVVRKFVPNPNVKTPGNEDLKSDSGPDYIVDEDAESAELLSSHDCSFDAKSFETADWNLLMEQEGQSKNEKVMTYTKYEKPEFLSNILIINDLDNLELSVVHNDEDNLLYDEMFECLQKEAVDLPPLNGIYEDKPCIGLFRDETGQPGWYRATIQRYSKSKGLVKVRYVDYGNTDVVSISNVKEISEKWLTLPPASIQVNLYKARVNPHVDVNIVSTKFIEIFLDKGPFQTKIMAYENSIPQVELRNEDGKLVYSKLLSSGYLIDNDLCTNDKF